MLNKKNSEKLKNFLLSPYFWLASLVLLYFSPMLLYPGFSYIDDGASILIAKKTLQAPLSEWPNYLLESHIGRMRPVYYLYFVFLYLVVGTSSFSFWLGQAATFFLFIVGMQKLTASKNKKLIIPQIFLLTVFMLLPQVIENTYRLGPAELRQAMFSVWFLVSLKSISFKKIRPKQILTTNLLFAAALLTKETAIILYPLFLVFFVSKSFFNKSLLKSRAFWILFSTLSLQVLFFFLMLPAQQGYSSALKFSTSRLWHRLLVSRLQIAEYYLLLSLAGIFSFIRLIIASKEKKIAKFIEKFTWQAMYLIAAASSLFFVFLWDYQLGRYYYLSLVFFWLYILAELKESIDLSKKIKKLSKEFLFGLVMVGSFSFFVIFIYVFQMKGLEWGKRATQAYDSAYNWFRGYQVSGSLTKYLYESVPEGTTIYTTTTNYEPLINIGYFSSRFGDRKIVVYSENKNAVKNHPEAHLYTTDVLAAYEADTGPKLLISSASVDKEVLNDSEYKILWPSNEILSHEADRFWRIKEAYK